MSSRLKLGNWTAVINACTSDTVLPVDRINDHLNDFLVCNDDSVEIIDKTTNLAITSIDQFNNQEYPLWLPEGERPDWEKFLAYLTNILHSSNSSSALNTPYLSWPISGFGNPNHLFAFEENIDCGFSALVFEKPQPNSYIHIFLYTLFLATRWHIEHNSLCLHSAGVERKNKGFLFLGDSGAGKTTIVKLSASVNCSGLGDDLNFVVHEGEGNYLLASAPSLKPSPAGYSLSRPKLEGIFKLIQAEKDNLIPISQTQLAKILFYGLLQVPKTTALSKNEFGIALHTIASIARTVPGYELHFRKSPDFWKLIDAEFPD